MMMMERTQEQHVVFVVNDDSSVRESLRRHSGVLVCAVEKLRDDFGVPNARRFLVKGLSDRKINMLEKTARRIQDPLPGVGILLDHGPTVRRWGELLALAQGSVVHEGFGT
jgi:hypothetical protein